LTFNSNTYPVSNDFIPFISSYIDALSSTLRPLSLKIHDNPELNFKEYIAHETLTKFLKTRKGWRVTPSAYGIETAFVAVFDSGREGPVVSYNAEYGTSAPLSILLCFTKNCDLDALAGVGHACGHNLIAICSVGAALAAAAAMTEFSIPGEVVLFGTPAEEGGGGKIKLLEAGAYTDHNVDISLISHPGPAHNAALVRTTAYKQFQVEYFGKEAHAAAMPWEGINALDALSKSPH